MSDRVYLLLDVTEGKVNQAAGKLRRIAGIKIVDVVEGKPDIIVVVETPQRQKTAEQIMRAVSSVEGMIEDLRLLPAYAGPAAKTGLRHQTGDRESSGKLEYA